MFEKLNTFLDYLIVNSVNFISLDELLNNCSFNENLIKKLVTKKMIYSNGSGYCCNFKQIYIYAKRLRDEKRYNQSLFLLEKIYRITLKEKYLNQIFKVNILNNDFDKAYEIFQIIYPPEFFLGKKISLPFLYLYLINNIKTLPKEYDVYVNILFNQDDYVTNDYIDKIVTNCITKNYEKALFNLNKISNKNDKIKSKIEVLKILIQMNQQKQTNNLSEGFLNTNYDAQEIDRLLKYAEINSISNLKEILEFCEMYSVDLENACLYFGVEYNQIKLILNEENNKRILVKKTKD